MRNFIFINKRNVNGRPLVGMIVTMMIISINSFSQNLVPDSLEFKALKDLYTNTDGSSWTTKTNWPTTWPSTATSAQFGTWYGVTVTNGDISTIAMANNNLTG